MIISDIQVPPYNEDSVPHFAQSEVRNKLTKIDTNHSELPGDISSNIIKQFDDQILIPLTEVINSSIKQGIWPDMYKLYIVTPVPKVYPPPEIKKLRAISGLLTFNKIQEQLIGQLIMSDIKAKLDPSQYANQRAVSLEHYLINMIHKILSETESNSTDVTAVLATLIDWQDAFPRQCPKLGVEAFIACGVRPSLIPVLMNYFQNRRMIVK